MLGLVADARAGGWVTLVERRDGGVRFDFRQRSVPVEMGAEFEFDLLSLT